MIYELVLITAVGLSNPLVTFDNREQCIFEAAQIKQQDRQIKAICVPTERVSMEEQNMKAQIGAQNMIDMFLDMKEQMMERNRDLEEEYQAWDRNGNRIEY